MTGEAARPYQRRIVYIYKSYQRRFIIRSCLLAAGAMLTASVVLYCLSRHTLTATYAYRHLALKTTAEAVLPALVMTNLFVLLCFVIATIVVNLYVSHKIGGPLYRFGKSLEAIGEGNLKLQVTLRKDDQLKDLAVQFNQMARSLNGRVGQVKEAVAALRQRTQSGDWEKDQIKDELERLQQKVSQLFETA